MRLICIATITALLALVTSTACSPKPMSAIEEAKLKAVYLDKYGEEMTQEQKNVFKTTRFSGERDAEILLKKFHEVNARNRALEGARDKAAAEIDEAEKAIGEYRAAVKKLSSGPAKNVPEMGRAVPQTSPNDVQRLERAATEKLAAARKNVGRTPFVVSEKSKVQSRLNLLYTEFTRIRDSRKSGTSLSGNAAAKAREVGAIRDAENAAAAFGELVEDEDILAEKARQNGLHAATMDFMAVCTKASEAEKEARVKIAEARKEIGESRMEADKKRALAAALDAIEARVNELQSKSAEISKVFAK